MMTTPRNAAEMAKAQAFDAEKNDAQILLDAERAMGRSFKHLDKDTFPIHSISVKERVELKDTCGPYVKGEIVTVFLPGDPFSNNHPCGPIEGFTEDGFAKINGRMYPLELLRA